MRIYIQHAVHPNLFDAIHRNYIIIATVRQRKASVTSSYDYQACQSNLFVFPLNVGVVSQPVSAWRTLDIKLKNKDKTFGDPFG